MFALCDELPGDKRDEEIGDKNRETCSRIAKYS